MKFGTIPKELKVGQIYTADMSSYRGYWDKSADGAKNRWHGRIALYLGESVIIRDDGVRIRNEKFLLDGVPTLTDKTFLKFIREIDNDE